MAYRLWAEAATAGFRGRLIARGQARAIIWRDGALPPDAPAFAPQLSYDLHSYAYALLGYVAAGSATMEQIMPILEERERQCERERKSRAAREAKKKG